MRLAEAPASGMRHGETTEREPVSYMLCIRMARTGGSVNEVSGNQAKVSIVCPHLACADWMPMVLTYHL